MTALKKFQRLESPGLWRESPEAQRRDVILSFGNASLMVSDSAERVLTHWSLAALERLNPGQMPALYSPGADSGETLEIEDDLMVDALETVRKAIGRTRPRPGRLRIWIVAATAAGIAALALFWLPGALVRQTVAVAPPEIRAEIGQAVLARMARAAGTPCERAGGQRALDRLSARLLPGSGKRVRVLPGGLPRALHLPGGLILLNRALVEDHEDVAAVAGFILAEDLRATRSDPLADLLRAAGPLATFRLLTTGTLPEAALSDYAREVLIAPEAPLPEAELLARFREAGLPSTPYALALDVTGESQRGLIEGDPLRGRETDPPISDGDWLRLQAICGG
ncbi:hypothetical protein [Rhodovulum sulfidophilum]|uniref:hypothetical protein n=1 Tax=Rhodovulum sulfidophilum TaxID=35806 RepID=UPI0009514415|nr:hypothetical protein [Rhodovulum sulfidophilum]MBL3551836.1 hypothetical protein [Rhodovulum sulfidophilum]OLS49267.1 hypothetical protein BV379_13925 [Rhodovulum sulfidophilum]